LTDLRKRGVAAVQSGEDPAHVAAVLGVNVRTVFRWLAQYRRGGWGKLDARKRGGGAAQTLGGGGTGGVPTPPHNKPPHGRVSLRLVDRCDGAVTDCRSVRRAPQSQLGVPVTEPAWVDRAAPTVASVSAGSRGGDALAGDRVSNHPASRPTRRGADLLRR